MELEKLRSRVKAGKKPSQTACQAIQACKNRLERLIGGCVIYPEDRIEIKASQQLLSLLHQIHHSPEFEADPPKAASLLGMMLRIFSFPISQSSIRKYFYRKE